MTNYLVAAFYKFVSLPDYTAMKPLIERVAIENNVMGTILLASEGINGTVSGPENGLRSLLDFIKEDPRLAEFSLRMRKRILSHWSRQRGLPWADRLRCFEPGPIPAAASPYSPIRA